VYREHVEVNFLAQMISELIAEPCLSRKAEQWPCLTKEGAKIFYKVV